LSDFEKGQIVGARLAGASATKTITLLGVSRVTLPKVMSAYTNHGKTTFMKGNNKRKSTLTEIYRRTLKRNIPKKHNCFSTGERTAELNIHP
jgi:DNA-binding protein Fis